MAIKIKSFTLSELLMVMIITAIVVGIAFSVLRLVQKQIHTIQMNYEKSTKLSLFEQRLWQDFNEFSHINYDSQKQQLLFKSELDSIEYIFESDFTIRNKDTIKLKLNIEKALFEGNEVINNDIDAVSISIEEKLSKYKIFISKKNDITLKMNEEDGIQIR